MKSLLFGSLALCLMGSAGAVGQVNGYVSSQPQIFEMSGHPSEASEHSMGQAHDIMGRSQNSYTRGERPMWEVMQEMHAPAATPLGDLARTIKKEHAAAKKATIVWTN
jgi:hypothetical protein